MDQAVTVAAIKGYLETICSIHDNPLARFVLDHGRVWESQALPEGFRRGEPKQCFVNSQQMLVQGTHDGDLVYVEGYACHSKLGFVFPIHHGWLVDPDGQVVDLTWEQPEGSVYFGVPFRYDYLIRQIRETRFWGSLLDSYESKFALVRGLHSVEDAVDGEW